MMLMVLHRRRLVGRGRGVLGRLGLHGLAFAGRRGSGLAVLGVRPGRGGEQGRAGQ